jgi:phosphatidylglycerophosphate synthase
MFKRKDYVTKLGAWTDRISIDLLAMPLTEILAKTPVTPNQITILSFFVSLVSAYFFMLGGRGNLIWGAIVWQIATVLDGTDGMLARKTDQCSEFGAKLDTRLDKIRKIINIAALVYSFRDTDYIIQIIILVVIHYLVRYIIPVRNNIKIQNFLHSKGLKSLFDPLDEQWFILFLGPVTGKFYLVLFLTVVLQIANKTIHFLFNIFESARFAKTDSET